MKPKLEGVAIVSIVVFIIYGILSDSVAKKNREADTYLFFATESRGLINRFDAGCLDDECRWWPSWSVMCKRRRG